MGFKSLLSLVSVVAVTFALPQTPPPTTLATCPDGTKVEHLACCSLVSLREDLQTNLYVNRHYVYSPY